jgi:hypothetical protein
MQQTKFLSPALVVALAACSSANGTLGGGQATPTIASMTASGAHRAITAPRGYRASVFIRGSAKRFNPDPIVAQGNFFYVAFQNATNPDGTGGYSTIVQYMRNGTMVKSIHLPGRCDGMRWNPVTKLMWLTVNEDANSAMWTWNPATDAITPYSFSSAKHGGGYDDLAFTNGKAFIAASNPTLSPRGINHGPALVSVVLRGKTAAVKSVLKGDAQAIDIPTGNTVTLNLTDPDSLSITPSGDVLLVSQADSEIVFVHNAGQDSQSVSRLLVGTQLDDTVFATQSNGRLYVSDSKANAIYAVRGQLQSGSIYTEAPSDAGVAGFVGTVDASTGIVTPVITGFQSPTGLIFVPDGDR